MMQRSLSELASGTEDDVTRGTSITAFANLDLGQPLKVTDFSNKILEEFGARLDARCLKRQTLLHIAASSGNVSMLQELLSRPKLLSLHNSVLHSKDDDGCTSLMLSVVAGYVDCVRVLLQNSVNRHEIFEDFKHNPLYIAARMGYTYIIQLLLMSEECLSLNNSHHTDEKYCRISAQNGEIFLEDLVILHGEKGCSLVNKIILDSNCDPRISRRLEQYVKVITRYKTTCLHLAALSGNVRTLEVLYCCYAKISKQGFSIQCDDIDRRNAFNQTPLHLAATTGAIECVKYLVLKGANLAAKIETLNCLTPRNETTAISHILINVPKGEDILMEILDECVTVKAGVLGHQDIHLDFRILCPDSEKRLGVLQEMYHYRERRMYPLLNHPLVKALIYKEWNKRKYSSLLTVHFVAYLLYIVMLTSYFLIQFDEFSRSILRAFLLSQCIGTLLVGFPFQIMGGVSKTEIIFRVVAKVCPHLLTFVALIKDYKPLSSFALISTWLAITHFTNVVPFVSYKFSMFHLITRKLVDQIFVFVYILAGFSFAFYLLYSEDENAAFKTLWESVLSTTVVVMQGDLGGTPLFKSANETNIPPDVLVAGGIMQQLFVVIVVLALLNMWVGLAVRSGRELERQGHINYHRNQVRLIYIMDELYTMFFGDFGKKKPAEKNNVLICDGDLPRDLISALRCNANQRNSNKVDLSDLALSVRKLDEKLDGLQRTVSTLREKQPTVFKEYIL